MTTDLSAVLSRVQSVFTPGSPVDAYALFAGRTAQVQEILRAIRGKGQHAALFGERGVGKTSLANVLSEILGNALPVLVVKITASKGDTFSDIWRRIGRDIKYDTKTQSIGFQPSEKHHPASLEEALGSARTPDDVAYILRQITIPLVLVIDEFDRTSGGDVTRLMADCVKTLSDNAVTATIVLVGVANDIDELIAEHASIDRALIQVRMPRMSAPELGEIITRGESESGVAFESSAKQLCVMLAQGLPHYTHLLALYSAERALDSARNEVTSQDVRDSIQTALDKAQQSTQNLYHKATSSPRRDNLYTEVLTACALAPTDSLGYFAPSDVRDHMRRVTGRPYEIGAFAKHLRDLCLEIRGPVLERTGTERRYRYRFINPLMQPYVLLNALAIGTLPESELGLG
jgi:Cdc6-like AAA superfamily ATPase